MKDPIGGKQEQGKKDLGNQPGKTGFGGTKEDKMGHKPLQPGQKEKGKTGF